MMCHAISVTTGGNGADPATLAIQAQEAEAAGWDAMLVGDYLWLIQEAEDNGLSEWAVYSAAPHTEGFAGNDMG